MKKLLYSIATLAILCFAAGCQREVDIDPVKGELVETEFVVTLDDATVTKAAIGNQAAFIDKLVIATFKKSNGQYLADLNEANGNFTIQPVATNNDGHKQFAVKAKLVRNFAYTIGFFAMNQNAPYTLGTDGVITMTAADANDETLDAFFAAEDITLDPDTPASLTKSITLTRPLAQINVLSDPADWAAASTSGITANLQSSISIAKAPNKISLLDGDVSGEVTLAFNQTAIPEGTINVAAANETAINAKYVAMAYILSADSASPVDVTFTVPANGTDFTGFTRTVQNVPNKRNYKTNLHGDLFTTQGDFTVVISEGFGGNDNQDINIPQPTITPVTNSTIPESVTTANPGITVPTVTTGNNVTTSTSAGPLYFGIDSNSSGAITYSSSDHTVGTIDNNGVFTAVGPGTTNITVTQAAGTQTKAIGDPLAELTIVYHVTVEGPTTYAITKNNPENGTLTIKIGDDVVTEAEENATITVVAAPADGYQVATLTYTEEGGDPVDIKATGSFTMPAKAVAVNATFELIPPSNYTITVNQPAAGGTIAASATSATEGTEITLTPTPATGYELGAWTVMKGSEAVPVADNKFSMPAGDVTVTATFNKINYTISVGTLTGGSLSAAASANYGDEVTVTVTPADGKQLKSGTLKYTPAGASAVAIDEGTKKFTMPAANVTLSAEFEDIPVTTYNVTIDGTIEHGTIVASPVNAAAGAEITLTITPDSGYQLKDNTLVAIWNGTPDIEIANNKFTMPAGDVEVSAEFELIPVKTLTGIEITTASTLLEFTVGDTFDFDGVVTATFANATPATETIAKADLVFKDENNNVLTPGTTVLSSAKDELYISVEYTYGGVTKSDIYTIVVNAAAQGKTLSSIEVTQNPTKASYIVLDTFSADGLEVTAHYSDNSTADVTNSISYDTDTATLTASSSSDPKSVTVSYTEGGVTKTASFNVTVSTVTDVLNNANTINETTTTYSEWSNKTDSSHAVYAGQSAGQNGTIQLRTTNSNSGVISTTTGGLVKSVKIKFNSSTADARIVWVYGSNTAYTSPANLFDNSLQGTRIAEITKSSEDNTVIEIVGDYKYIGLRSSSGALYIDSIEIVWK